MKSAEDTSQTRIAILAIILSVAALSLSDAIIKAKGVSLPLWQMLLLRSCLVVPALWWVAWRRGWSGTTVSAWAVVRAAMLVLMWLSYYSALPLMPLSLAAAAYYTGPLFIVVLAACVARKLPSLRAIFAILIGFIGVLLIIRPDASEVSLGAVLPIIAAFLYACAMVLTSFKCRRDDLIVLALVLNLAFIGSGALLGLLSGQEGSFILGPWKSVDRWLLLVVLLLAILFVIGSVGAAIAYQKGPPIIVGAFDYSYLVLSLVWGGLFFLEIPDTVGFVGILSIMAAGLLTLTKRPTSKR